MKLWVRTGERFMINYRGKKVVFLSLKDECGSGYKMVEAINLNTFNFVEYIVLVNGTDDNAYKYPFIYKKKKGVPGGWNVPKRVLDHAQGIINNSDIIHLDEDELPEMIDGNYNFHGLILPKDTPRVITVGGRSGSYEEIGRMWEEIYASL